MAPLPASGDGARPAAGPLLLLVAAMAAAGYARYAFGPVQETVGTSLSLSDHQIALLQGLAPALPMVAAAVPLGLLIDRWTRTRLLLILVVALVAGTVLTALAQGFAMLFVARSLVGLSAAGCAMTIGSLVGDLVAPAWRGRVLTFTGLGNTLGMSAAFAVAGALFAVHPPAGEGWRAVMLMMTLPLLAALPLALALREPARSETLRSDLPASGSFAALWAYRRTVAPLLLGSVLVGMADCAALVWAAPILERGFGLTPERVGWIMGAVLLASGIVGTLAGGVLADLCQRRGGPRRSVGAMALLALFSAPAGCFALAPNAALAAVMLALLIVAGAAVGVLNSTLMIVVVPNEVRGLCFGLANILGSILGVALAPLLVSAVSSALGGPAFIGVALALASLVSGGLASAALAMSRRHFRLVETADG